jgi:hypothetical protein
MNFQGASLCPNARVSLSVRELPATLAGASLCPKATVRARLFVRMPASLCPVSEKFLIPDGIGIIALIDCFIQSFNCS